MESQDMRELLVQMVRKVVDDFGPESPVLRLSAKAIDDLRFVAKNSDLDSKTPLEDALSQCETVGELCATIYPIDW